MTFEAVKPDSDCPGQKPPIQDYNHILTEIKNKKLEAHDLSITLRKLEEELDRVNQPLCEVEASLREKYSHAAEVEFGKLDLIFDGNLPKNENDLPKEKEKANGLENERPGFSNSSREELEDLYETFRLNTESEIDGSRNAAKAKNSDFNSKKAKKVDFKDGLEIKRERNRKLERAIEAKREELKLLLKEERALASDYIVEQKKSMDNIEEFQMLAQKNTLISSIAEEEEKIARFSQQIEILKAAREAKLKSLREDIEKETLKKIDSSVKKKAESIRTLKSAILEAETLKSSQDKQVREREQLELFESTANFEKIMSSLSYSVKEKQEQLKSVLSKVATVDGEISLLKIKNKSEIAEIESEIGERSIKIRNTIMSRNPVELQIELRNLIAFQNQTLEQMGNWHQRSEEIISSSGRLVPLVISQSKDKALLSRKNENMFQSKVFRDSLNSSGKKKEGSGKKGFSLTKSSSSSNPRKKKAPNDSRPGVQSKFSKLSSSQVLIEDDHDRIFVDFAKSSSSQNDQNPFFIPKTAVEEITSEAKEKVLEASQPEKETDLKPNQPALKVSDSFDDDFILDDF